ncbi:MAG TPA: tannase/feruloyl esterase family alpha/beta hydrolase [Acidobacteriota bacterium]|nr:tannase/feruloyl esterase family alpha/beta hydrolase [Acidobacteriota bacterium]
MNAPRISLWILLAIACVAASIAAAADQDTCANLAKQKHDKVTITSAEFMNDPQGFQAPKTPGVFGTPEGLKVTAAFCRVVGFIEPVQNSHIQFEVWLPPVANWNNRYFAVGNPAFEGAIKYQGLAKAIEKGYATASTDTGHEDPGHQWGMGHPERVVDWTHRAVHETTVVAKSLIKAFYGQSPRFSYWDSCHNGGRQGLTEAQLYPEDFDGIVAGDPAYYITHLQAGSEYLSWVALKDGAEAPGFIPPAKYPALHRAALDACDAKDGVKDDAIEDPARCNFDPASIQCKDEDNPTCLTAAQVDTARRIYAGAKFADGTQIYSGFEPGSELVWNAMIGGPEPLFINNGFFKYIAFENPDWDFRTFDLERDTRKIDAKLGPMINTTQTDLKAFKNHGGKLLMYQDWNETWVPPRTATTYYHSVVTTMGGENQTMDFYRLFMIPNFGMCAGMFTATFDALGAVQKWVEEGIAPDQVKMSYSDRGRVYRTRPVCPYPQVAIYKGTGDINDIANFKCGIPNW